LKGSKPSKSWLWRGTSLSRPFFSSKPLGVLLIIIASLSLITGNLRGELALILFGAVLLSVIAYCFILVMILTIIHRKKVYSITVRFSPEYATGSNQGTVLCEKGDNGKLLHLPGILIRYEIRLKTLDGRFFYHLFDPDYVGGKGSSCVFPERGAYYGARDKLLILDILGLFATAFTLPQVNEARLFSIPCPAEKAPPLQVHSGGSEQRREPHFLHTDNLIDHRPYIPGDDPRRINWKLYGHAGDLFVREGEREPPPHSRLVLLIDTQADPGIFSPEAGRRAVDLLCENALALIFEYAGEGIEISIGFEGLTEIREGTPAELTSVLAYPAALPLNSNTTLPEITVDTAVLILALPRLNAENSALDRFLKNQGKHKEIDILFIFQGDNFDEAAAICTQIYTRKPGVRAQRLRLGTR
jgi:hypothetical protein